MDKCIAHFLQILPLAIIECESIKIWVCLRNTVNETVSDALNYLDVEILVLNVKASICQCNQTASRVFTNSQEPVIWREIEKEKGAMESTKTKSAIIEFVFVVVILKLRGCVVDVK